MYFLFCSSLPRMRAFWRRTPQRAWVSLKESPQIWVSRIWFTFHKYIMASSTATPALLSSIFYSPPFSISGSEDKIMALASCGVQTKTWEQSTMDTDPVFLSIEGEKYQIGILEHWGFIRPSYLLTVSFLTQTVPGFVSGDDCNVAGHIFGRWRICLAYFWCTFIFLPDCLSFYIEGGLISCPNEPLLLSILFSASSIIHWWWGLI